MGQSSRLISLYRADLFVYTSSKNSLFPSWNFLVPTEELFSSYVGTESFQRWKIEFPREENKVSSVGKTSNAGKFLES